MNPIYVSVSPNALTPQSALKNTPSIDAAASVAVGETSLTASPIVVVISADGKEKLAGDQQKNADIDASKLPDRIKKYLKSIRDIQEKIEKKQQELQAIMKDHSLSEKERQAKISGIQLELAVLSNVLTSMTNDLHQAEVQMKLQLPDLTEINSLMSPG